MNWHSEITHAPLGERAIRRMARGVLSLTLRINFRSPSHAPLGGEGQAKSLARGVLKVKIPDSGSVTVRTPPERGRGPPGIEAARGSEVNRK